MVDGVPTAETARQWLMEHCADDPEEKIQVAWKATEPNEAVLHRLLEIIFGPPPGGRAA